MTHPDAPPADPVSPTPETAGTSADPAAADGSLVHDLQCVARACLPPDMARDFTDALATKFARLLHQRIGGSYVKKEALRIARNRDVLAAFDGRNHTAVMRRFGISRRLLYNIIAWGRARK